MVRFALLLGLVWICLLVFCLVEVIRTRGEEIRLLPKVVWLSLVLLFPIFGSVAWLIAGRPEKAARRPDQRNGPGFGEYDRPRRAATSSPDQDAAFQRQVRARAEEQRRKLEEQQKRDREEKDGPAEPPVGQV